MSEVFYPKDVAQLLYSYMKPTDNYDIEGYDATLAVHGRTGYGKSDFLLYVNYELSKLLGRPWKSKRDVQDSLIWTRKELADFIRFPENYRIAQVDEAIKVLFSRDDVKNSNTIKDLNICRNKNLALSFSIPAFNDIDSKIRNTRIQISIWIKSRGKGYLFLPDNKPHFSGHQPDPWNSKLIDKYATSLWKHPRFLAEVRWSKAPSWIRAAYDESKDKHALEEEESDEVPYEVAKRVMIDFIHHIRTHDSKSYRGLMTTIASFMSVDRSTVYNWLSSCGKEGIKIASMGKDDTFEDDLTSTPTI